MLTFFVERKDTMLARQTKKNMSLGLPPKNEEVKHAAMMLDLRFSRDPLHAEMLARLVLLCPVPGLFAIC
jgi:hypothetical protein